MNPHSVISVYATVPREIHNKSDHVIWCEHCGGTIAVGEIHKCRDTGVKQVNGGRDEG